MRALPYLLSALGLLLALAWLRRWEEFCLALPLLLLPLFSGSLRHPLWSLPRFTVVILPFYGVLGWLCARHAAFGGLLLAGMATLNGMLMVCWVTGRRLIL
ncbi:hypothetical protein [Megalodesulfovibrio paquesii]